MSVIRFVSFPVGSAPIRKIAVAALCATGLASSVRADFFVIDGDNVGRYSDAGATINSAFVVNTSPTGLAVGPDNSSLYVGTATSLDGGQITKYNLATGASLGVFTSHVQDDPLNNPQGMAFGSDGRLYVTEAGGGSILAYGPAGGAHAQSYTDFSVANSPWGLAFDASGTTAYIADRNGFYLGKLDTGTGSLTTVNTTLGLFTTLTDVTLDGTGFAYGINPDGIFKIDLSNGDNHTRIVDPVASNFAFGESHITYGPGGLLYVTGIDGADNHGVVQTYQTDGTPVSRFIDLGFANSSGPMTIVYTPVPEPATWGMGTALGLAGLALVRRRFNKRRAS
jgi:sugar lactone lactonase YvrE